MKKKIGWQKYENLIEDQLNSPLLNSLQEKLNAAYNDAEFGELEEIDEISVTQEKMGGGYIIPIDEKLMENVSLATNFDCWMGHTNFDITEKVKDVLNEADGVEVLKICSRYRFFVGVGRMFDFKEVRKSIENKLTEEAINAEEDREVSE